MTVAIVAVFVGLGTVLAVLWACCDETDDDHLGMP